MCVYDEHWFILIRYNSVCMYVCILLRSRKRKHFYNWEINLNSKKCLSWQSLHKYTTDELKSEKLIE